MALFHLCIILLLSMLDFLNGTAQTSFICVNWPKHGGTISGVIIMPVSILTISVVRSYWYLTPYIVWMSGERYFMRY